MRAIQLAGASLLAVLALRTADGTGTTGWSKDTAVPDETITVCDCGNIPGKVGKLVDFVTDTGGSGVVTTGTVGAEYANPAASRFPVCTAPLASNENSITHKFKKPYDSFDPTQQLEIDLTSTVTVSGAQNQFQPNTPWWWDTTLTAKDNVPTFKMFFPDAVDPNVPGSGWTTIAITGHPGTSQNTQANSQGGDAGNQGATPPTSNNNTTTNPQSSASNAGGQMTGRVLSTFDLAIGTRLATKIEIKYSWVSTAKASGDDVTVNNDALRLAFTAKTTLK